jgi:NAD(P)H-dependent FMN reductase
MSIRVLALAGSPRVGGNSDTLLARAIEAARAAGAEVEHVLVRKMKIAPCLECGGCEREGVCIVEDDFQSLWPRIEQAERLLIATPMFFGHMSGQIKAVIDRCQMFWSRKYIVKRPMPALPNGRKGYLLAVAGQPRVKFDCMAFTMRVLMDSLDGEYAGALTFNGLDARGDADRHPTALDDALLFGRQIVTPEQ